MSLAGRPSKTGRHHTFDVEESRVRSRLERLSQKRDTEHRLNVREALVDRERARRYAAERFDGASTATGVRAPGLADGVYVFDPDTADQSAEWRTVAGVNHVLAALAFADVTSSYTPMSEETGTRLTLVRRGRAIALLVALDRDGDDKPDSLMHVWVAGHHRRKGNARRLVRVARERWPMTSIVGPINTARTAGKFAATVDLPILDRV